MARQFQVIGTDVEGNEVLGEVEGAVLGRGGHRRMHALPARADWRGGQMAPGVQQPDEGLVTLPMEAVQGAQTGGGQFSATVNAIQFRGQLQKPFRGERILVGVTRTGASSTGRLMCQLFVGTDLQGADITQWDIELNGQAQAFGTRFTMKQAEPGVLIRALVTPSAALAGTDTIFMSLQIMGRIIH